MVDRVLGVALDQRAGDFRRLVEPPRPQLPYHERGSGNWRARLCTEHLFQRGETLLALTGIDLRSPDLCLDGWVIGIESGGFFELLQREIGLAVRHIGVSQHRQCRRICRHPIDQWLEVFDRP